MFTQLYLSFLLRMFVKNILKVKCVNSKFSNLSNWKEEAWKKIRVSTGFEPMTSAIPVRCSTNWAMKPHIGSKVNLLSSYLPVQWNHVKYIWYNSYLYCGSRWKWSVIIAVNRTSIAEVMGDTGEQFVQLLVITDSQLKVTGDDSCLLVVTSSVARQLEDLSPKLLDSVSMPMVQRIAYLSFLLPGLLHACSRTEHCLMR